MRQRLGFVITVVVVIGILIAMNSLTFVTQEEKHDSELLPDRSTYHRGPTGTKALYDLLSEGGYSVMRWRENPERLLSESSVKTFVIVGNTKQTIDEGEASNILHWVKRGGQLVLIDRRPEVPMLPSSGDWYVATQLSRFPDADVDPSNQGVMTDGVKPLTPSQETLLTHGIHEVMPSRFAAKAIFSLNLAVEKEGVGTHSPNIFDDDEEAPPPEPITETAAADPASPAPVIHLQDEQGPLLIDYVLGNGRIILLTDPYMVSNGGISLADNVQLALNILGSAGGLIAFDEFHQGHAASRNALISYFSGTPILPLAAQLLFLILLIVWNRGRRFARPLPLTEVDRRSALEFVASMAEVQERSRAFDLAIENIYSRMRRLLARYAGLEYNSPRKEIAARVALRAPVDVSGLEVLMKQCEEAINGQPISEKQALNLVVRLRELESKLGFRMRSRDVKQAAQKVAG
jgi:uncharacterized protein DUF4350